MKKKKQDDGSLPVYSEKESADIIRKYNNLMKQKECKCFRIMGSKEPFQTYLCDIHKKQ